MTNFPDVVRGYLYAVILFSAHALTDALGDSQRIIFKIFTSVAYAYLLTGPIYNFFCHCFGGKSSLERRTLFSILIFLLYPGLFAYPLSDLPAVILTIIGVYLSDSANKKHWPIFLFLSGAALSAAYNVRTIYIFSFFLTAALIPLAFFKENRQKQKPLR